MEVSDLPSAALSVGSTVCLIAAHGENQRRNAALATAYALSESALKDYREKVTETVGPKKAEAVDDAVARDKLKPKPSGKSGGHSDGQGFHPML